MTKPSPESKALRDLVTAIKKGRKPDVTAAEAALNLPDSAHIAVQEDYLCMRRSELGFKLQKRLWASDPAKAAYDAYVVAGNAINNAVSAFTNSINPRKEKLLSDARSGKLTRKQFDKAVKDFFK